jgi:hypothetical protein
MTMNQSSAHEIDLAAEFSVTDGKSLQVRYEVTNRSATPIALLNFVRQPMAEADEDPDRAFVEAQPDGTVVISQRGLVESRPSSKRPVHRAVLVDAGGSFAGDFELPLPLQYANPEAPGAGSEVPDPPERVQLCLGYVPASRFTDAALEEIRAGGELRAIRPDLSKEQGFLRTEVLTVG